MDAQDVIALGIVALVVALFIWRRARRRHAGPDCADCPGGAPGAGKGGRGEAPLRFYRRRPGGPDGGSGGARTGS